MEIEILQLIEGARKAKGLTVVIDVFRAFTVEAWLLAQNAMKVIPVGDIETAFSYRNRHPGTILCGERDGAVIPGFDFGNSPSAFEYRDLTGKTVVHTTSAGTQGIVNAIGADCILGGSLVVAKATAQYIKKQNPEYVSLVCMGLAGKHPTDEDTLCAWYIKSILEGNPLEDIRALASDLRLTDGAKFFDPSNQSVFPEQDFHLSTQVDRFSFAMGIDYDEDGVMVMKRLSS